MSERRLIAALMHDRTAYDIVIDKLEEDDLTEQGTKIVSHIHDYYTLDPDAKQVDPEALSEAVGASLPNPKHRQVFENIIAEIACEDVSAANAVKLYLAQKRDVVGSKLATALVSKSPDVMGLVEEFTEWSERDGLSDKDDTDVVLHGIDLSQLVQESFEDDALIKVSPKALNDRLDGGVLRGHHIVVFARPEMGKTLLVCNMAAGFLQQGLRVLYVGNEEPVQDTYLRMVCRLSGKARHEVVSDPTGSQAAAKELLDNLFMASMSPGSLKQIENLAEKVEADVIIVDQLRNIKVANENFTQALEQAAKGVRQIGKRRNCVTVSVTQAGDSAHGRAVLDMGDIDSSNTGIPAQADVLVGLGASPSDVDMGRRIISLPKNKRGGNHDNFPVQVDINTSTIRSIV